MTFCCGRRVGKNIIFSEKTIISNIETKSRTREKVLSLTIDNHDNFKNYEVMLSKIKDENLRSDKNFTTNVSFKKTTS